jgi:membrane-bound inhibitor of C-type lysozyme
MKVQFLIATGLVGLLTACGKPAAEQPAPQIATAEPAAASAPEAPSATTPADDSAIPADRSTPEQRAQTEAAAAAAGLPVTNESRGEWACDNGETIELRFFPDQGIAVLVRGGQNIELQQERVASGIKYSNGQTTIRGKGDEIELTVGMMATTMCKAKTS